jgi:hypothetical protein
MKKNIDKQKQEIMDFFNKSEKIMLEHFEEVGIRKNDQAGIKYDVKEHTFLFFKWYEPVVVGNAYNDIIDDYMKAQRKCRDLALKALEK